MKNRCGADAWTDFGNGHGRWLPCSMTGKVQVDGKWYCGIHDPAAVERRKQRSKERYEAMSVERNKRWEREIYNQKAGDACRALGILDPSELITHWVKRSGL